MSQSDCGNRLLSTTIRALMVFLGARISCSYRPGVSGKAGKECEWAISPRIKSISQAQFLYQAPHYVSFYRKPERQGVYKLESRVFPHNSVRIRVLPEAQCQQENRQCAGTPGRHDASPPTNQSNTDQIKASISFLARLHEALARYYGSGVRAELAYTRRPDTCRVELGK